MSSNSTCLSPGVAGACLTRLSTAQAVGLMVDFESGSISFLAVLIFMALIVRNVIRHYNNPPEGGWSLLRTHIDAYLLCLMGFELIHGVAAMMNIKWVYTETVSCGAYCTIQGITRNLGSTGVALVTLVIAIHTFAVIFFEWIPPKGLIFPVAVMAGIWVILITYICCQLLIHRDPAVPFYGPAPYWCWIGPSHTTAQVWGQYLWMWLAAFMSILLYVPLYFCVKGNLSYRPNSRWKVRITRTQRPVGGGVMQTHASRVATKEAMCMLYYPAVYVLLVLPLSIVRFMSESWQQHGKHFPFAPTLSAIAIFGLSGVMNVILFVVTRPNVLLFRSPLPQPPPHSRGRSEDALLSGWQRQADCLYPPSALHSPVPVVAGMRAMQSTWDLDATSGKASR